MPRKNWMQLEELWDFGFFFSGEHYKVGTQKKNMQRNQSQTDIQRTAWASNLYPSTSISRKIWGLSFTGVNHSNNKVRLQRERELTEISLPPSEREILFHYQEVF